MNPLRWLAEEAWEKVNLAATWRELKDLGRKHGTRFFVVAVLWEVIEDVLFPTLAYRAGYPALIPVFLVLHFEPVVYPVFFFLFRTWDRLQGREPWEPDRLAMSSYWRTSLKVLSHRLLSIALFLWLLADADIGLGLLSGYTVGMTLFAYAHDRLWHDLNYGIDIPTDTVHWKRVVVKATTYRTVSALVMCGVFKALVGYIPVDVYVYQTLAFGLGLALSFWWARNTIGIQVVRA